MFKFSRVNNQYGNSYKKYIKYIFKFKIIFKLSNFFKFFCQVFFKSSDGNISNAYFRLGLLGLEKLVQWALHEWLSDIKRHQLPGLLSGIGPMHSLLQLS